MNVFGWNISIQREQSVRKDGTEHPLSAGFWPDEARTGTVLSNAYEQVVWVYRAINALAEQVSNIPFRFSTTTAAGETAPLNRQGCALQLLPRRDARGHALRQLNFLVVGQQG